MKTSLQKALLRIHFITLAIAIFNGGIKSFTAYSLERNCEFGVEILLVLSGLILFFFYVKPVGKSTLYFALYATGTTLLFLGLLFRGLFWALVLSIILYPLAPDNTVFEENGITIATPFQGFLAPCCTYRITAKHLLLFEKEYGTWQVVGEGPIDFETVHIAANEKEIEITYATTFNSNHVKVKKILK